MTPDVVDLFDSVHKNYVQQASPSETNREYDLSQVFARWTPRYLDASSYEQPYLITRVGEGAFELVILYQILPFQHVYFSLLIMFYFVTCCQKITTNTGPGNCTQETVPLMHTLHSVAGNEDNSSNFENSLNLAARQNSEALSQVVTTDVSQQGYISFSLPSLNWQFSLEPSKVSTSLLHINL